MLGLECHGYVFTTFSIMFPTCEEHTIKANE